MPTTLRDIEVRLSAHEAECLAVRRETVAGIKAVADKIDNIEKLPMKAVRWLGSIIVVAAITNIVTTYLTHQETAQKASLAAVSAEQAAGVGDKTLAAVKSIQAAQTNSVAPP
jgi:hypothetical protein